MEGMKKLSTICVIWFMIMTAVVASLAVVEHEEEMSENQLGYVTFELYRGSPSYSRFLKRLRNAVEAPIRPCGLQSTRMTALPGTEYGYANLLISNTKWVTLGIDTRTLYVFAYQDNVKYNGRFRANFFKDSPDEARANLFRGSTIRNNGLLVEYSKLERAAGVSRLNLVLGIGSLEGAIENVYNKQENQIDHKQEAKFLLLAIQMVSEAARFKFMEEAIVGGYSNTPHIRQKMVAFQNDWDQISDAIHNAEAAKPKCIKITPTLVISRIGYRQEVNAVAEIKDDIGILKFKS